MTKPSQLIILISLFFPPLLFKFSVGFIFTSLFFTKNLIFFLHFFKKIFHVFFKIFMYPPLTLFSNFSFSIFNTTVFLLDLYCKSTYQIPLHQSYIFIFTLRSLFLLIIDHIFYSDMFRPFKIRVRHYYHLLHLISVFLFYYSICCNPYGFISLQSSPYSVDFSIDTLFLLA